MFKKIFSWFVPKWETAVLPEGYIHYRQSLKYLQGEPVTPERAKIVGQPGAYGLRFQLKNHFYVESYTTDQEPKIEKLPYLRMILWETLTRDDTPSGWWRNPAHHNLREIGVCDLKHPKEYWKRWSAHAQRHRKKWLLRKDFSIREVPLSDFIEAYRRSNKLPEWRDTFIDTLEKRSITNSRDLRLFGAVEKKTGKILAGLAVLDLPDVNTSKHMIAFLDDTVAKTSVNVGLIDHWFRYCARKKIRFLDFGIFWHRGDKEEFKGFSQFKSQFDIQYIIFPPELERWCKAGETW